MKRMLVMGLIAYSLSAQDSVLYLYSHGLGGNAGNVRYYEKVSAVAWCGHDNAGWIVKQPLVSFNFPDAVDGFNSRKTSLAQENEIETLKQAYFLNQNAADKKVLFGVSRGASVSLSFAGQYAPACLKVVIAESPFDSVSSILNVKLAQEGVKWIPNFITRTAPTIVCRQYNPAAKTPAEWIVSIPHGIAILLICSLPDKIVPARSTANLYIRLLQIGHPHVYLLMLDHGEHVNMLWDRDGDIYMYVVHAFYKHYNLPYNEEYAIRGAYYLSQCQPSVASVEQALKNNHTYIQRARH